MLECAFSALVRGRPVHAGWGGAGVDPEARTYIVRTESRGTFMVTYAVDEAGEGGACAQLIADGCNGAVGRWLDAESLPVLSCPTAGDRFWLCDDRL